MSMTTREYMARQLRSFRNQSGLSVDEVGKRIGKSGKTISAWEVGRGQPDADKLVELCEIYNVRISDFYIPLHGQQEYTISPDEYDLLETYRQLNESGKLMARGLVSALAKSGDYDI